jgi:hypothetical protein
MKKIFILSFIASLILPAIVIAGTTIGSCAKGHNCVCVHYDESMFTSKYTYTDIYGVLQTGNVNLQNWQYIDLGDPNSTPNQETLSILIQYSTGSSWKQIYNGLLKNKQTLTINGSLSNPKYSISDNSCNVTN